MSGKLTWEPVERLANIRDIKKNFGRGRIEPRPTASESSVLTQRLIFLKELEKLDWKKQEKWPYWKKKFTAFLQFCGKKEEVLVTDSIQIDDVTHSSASGWRQNWYRDPWSKIYLQAASIEYLLLRPNNKKKHNADVESLTTSFRYY